MANHGSDIGSDIGGLRPVGRACQLGLANLRRVSEEWQRGEYEISTDPARVDLAAVHQFLSVESYWATGVPLDVMRRAIEGSMVFGIYKGREQVGFARVVSDKATFAWIGDVYVLDAHRGHGLGKWLMECIVGHPELHGLRRWMLATRDAHGLYAQTGFTPLSDPGRFMERWDREIYKRGQPAAPGKPPERR